MNDPDILIVGAGPGGISLAVELIEAGIPTERVLILEKGDVPIEAIRRFYPEKKMTVANYKNLPTETLGHLPVFPDLTKAETLTYFNEIISRYAIRIRFKAEVSKVMQRGGTLADPTSVHPETWMPRRQDVEPASFFSLLCGHEILRAPFAALGIGILGRPNKPEHKIPSSLKNRVVFDLTTVEIKNEDVLVVGGGDTSSEFAQILVAEGNRVTLAYRGEVFHRMLEQNRKALSELEREGKMRILLRSEIAELFDVNGQPDAKFKNGQHEKFDRIVCALGGTTPVNFLKTAGIVFDGDWPKLTDTGETNVPGLFLLGDLVAGKQGGSIITAYNASYRAAQRIAEQWKLMQA